MSHELSIRKNGLAEMAYVGEKAWHGLGQQLERGSSIEEWAVAAGMDWKIGRSRVRFGEGDNQRIYDDAHVLFRSDTKAPLGIVSPKFKTVQPREVLEFFRDLVAGNGFELETAGTLFGGKRFWALASIGESAVIGNADMVGGYVLLNTGADGETATSARFTTVRVVCNNTLSMALREKSKNVVRVTHRTAFDPASVKAQLGIAREQFGQFVEAMRELSRIRVSAVAADRMTAQLFEPKAVDQSLTTPEREQAQDEVRASKGFRQVMDLFVNRKAMGARLAGADGTAWGWVNAVTQYVDHGKTGARSYDAQLESAWMGKGDETKTRAVEIALGTA